MSDGLKWRGKHHPAWGLRTRALIRTLRRGARALASDRCPTETRRTLGRLGRFAPTRPGVHRRKRRLGGRPATWFVPRGASDNGPVIFYLHGGGYSLCSPRTHRTLVSDLVLATGLPAVAIRYRLAPEHPFPAAQQDCLGAYRDLLKSGVDPKSVIFCGDSAGGGLALSLLQTLIEHGEPLPRGSVLISPWVDLTCSGESIEFNAPYDYLSRTVLESYAAHYLSGQDPSNPKISPRFADLTDFPPMLIQVGTAELLLSEARVLARRADEHGVAVQLEEWEGMFHAWHGFSLFMPEAKQAFEAIGRYVNWLLADYDPQRALAVSDIRSVLRPAPDSVAANADQTLRKIG